MANRSASRRRFGAVDDAILPGEAFLRELAHYSDQSGIAAPQEIARSPPARAANESAALPQEARQWCNRGTAAGSSASSINRGPSPALISATARSRSASEVTATPRPPMALATSASGGQLHIDMVGSIWRSPNWMYAAPWPRAQRRPVAVRPAPRVQGVDLSRQGPASRPRRVRWL